MLAAAWTKIFLGRSVLFLAFLLRLLLVALFIFFAHLEILFREICDHIVVAVNELAFIVEVRDQIRIAAERQQFLIGRFLLDIAFVQIDVMFVSKLRGYRTR